MSIHQIIGNEHETIMFWSSNEFPAVAPCAFALERIKGYLYIYLYWPVSCRATTQNLSFSLQRKSDWNTKHYITQILLAIN